jgi:hypothetical protein
MRNFVISLIVLVVGLLVGFIPEYLKVHRAQEELTTCNAGLELAEARQSAALMYVSATQLNYGVAAGYAQVFYTQVQHLASSASDAGVRANMNDVLSTRDKVTADLAKGSNEVVSELQPVLLEVEQGSGSR